MDLTEMVSERDHIQGPSNAPLTLVVYGDYECPYTRRALISVSELRRQLGDRLRFVFRNFPLYEIHPHALRTAEAAEAAAAQGSELFWRMHSYLFAHQKALEDEALRQYAGLSGLDLPGYDHDMAVHTHAGRIEHDVASGLDSGVEGTPSLFINGQRYAGSFESQPLLQALERSAQQTPR